MPIFVWAILGGAVAVWWINSSIQTWKPIAASPKIPYQALDVYAQQATKTPGTLVKFAVTQGGNSNAVLIGSVQQVAIQSGVRVWRVRAEQIFASVGTTKPTIGELYTLTDDNLLA